MKAWLKRLGVLSAGLALILSGCGGNKESTNHASSNAPMDAASGKKLKVVTTIYPMYEFARQVGGEHAEVIALIPPGAEPHDWEPSAKDMALLKEADIFVYNGIVEGWAEKALASAANDKRIVVEAVQGIELMEGKKHEHGHGHEDEEEGHEHEDEEHGHEEEHEGHEHDGEEEPVPDPHVWLDPVLAQEQVKSILAAFEKADPANKTDYRKNAEAYITKLKELDEAYQSGLKDAKRKAFVTQHAAFGYLAKRYGLTQIPIAGLSPEQEPSPDKMAEIIKLAKELQIKTIFFETLVDPKVARTIADEIGAKTDVLNPLEGLTDEDKKNNLDYIGIMKNNLEALKKALNE